MMTPEIRSDLIKHSDEYVHALMTNKEASKYMLKLYNFLAEDAAWAAHEPEG